MGGRRSTCTECPDCYGDIPPEVTIDVSGVAQSAVQWVLTNNFNTLWETLSGPSYNEDWGCRWILRHGITLPWGAGATMRVTVGKATTEGSWMPGFPDGALGVWCLLLISNVGLTDSPTMQTGVYTGPPPPTQNWSQPKTGYLFGLDSAALGGPPYRCDNFSGLALPFVAQWNYNTAFSIIINCSGASCELNAIMPP